MNIKRQPNLLSTVHSAVARAVSASTKITAHSRANAPPPLISRVISAIKAKVLYPGKQGDLDLELR